MNIGFTGSSTKVTLKQMDSLRELFRSFDRKLIYPQEEPLKIHHGDCIMADEKFHQIGHLENKYYVVIHPPKKNRKRAFCVIIPGLGEMREPKEYLDRNKDIVDETETLIAMPDSYEEKLRSGTWSTVRYAIKQMKQVYIIFPDGSIEIR